MGKIKDTTLGNASPKLCMAKMAWEKYLNKLRILY